MPFKTPGGASEYIRTIIRPETGLLKDICDYADLNFIPVLLPETAAFLKQIVRLKNPLKALEIGTAVGYSSQVILRNSGAHLFTVEIDEKRAKKAAEYFESAGFTQRVTQFIGDAGEIVPLIEGEFDFVIMDGPKTRYIEYLPYLKKLLIKGGVMFCDNVFFNGMVSGENEREHKKSTIIDKLDMFLHALTSDDGFETSILPVGDGVSLSIKLI